MDLVEKRLSVTACNVFNDLRRNRQLCDVVLDVDGREFHAHKNILSACSPYFRALFTNGMTESDMSRINIPNVSYKIMNYLIEFAYTREITLTVENVEGIFAAGDQFLIHGIVQRCKDFLLSHIGPENCFGIRNFARAYFCRELEEIAMHYILVHFEEIVTADDADEFLNLSLADLIDLICRDNLNVKMEEYVFEAVLRWIKYEEVERRQNMPEILMHIRLGMTNTDYFMNNVKANEYVRENDLTKPIIIQTLNYTYNFDTTSATSGPSQVISRPRLPYKLLYAIGGWSGGSPTNTVECYDTRADRWSIIDTENSSPRAYMGIAVVSHKLYAMGGFDSNQYFNSVRSFDPVTKRWDEVSPMHSRRCYVSVAVLDGCIYAMGGFDGHTRLRTVERYDPKTNQWRFVTSMNHHRSDASASQLDGRVYICGGFNGNECLNSAEYFDPTDNTWNDLPRMTSRRSGVGVVAYHDCIYAVGGFNGLTRLNTLEKYDPHANNWVLCPSMYIHRSNFGVTVLDDMIFVIGGFNGVTTIFNVECYDGDNDEWYDACDMNVFRSALNIGVIAGLPNVTEYVWPRDQALPPPVIPNNQENIQQAARALEENLNRVDEAELDIGSIDGDDGSEDEEDDEDEEVPVPDRPPNHRRPPSGPSSGRDPSMHINL
ncbi:kelch-like protein 10 [Antedon mediterranea]|uniref:kelch-like protein 10 n=1 Tax=Antedon mediterranea TaxID=105859 RepID=UPI003AF8F93A